MPTQAFQRHTGVGYVTKPFARYLYSYLHRTGVSDTINGPAYYRRVERWGMKTPAPERAAFFKTNGYHQPFSYTTIGKDLNYVTAHSNGGGFCAGYGTHTDLDHDASSRVRLDNIPFLSLTDAKFVSLRNRVIAKLATDVRSNSAGMGETLFELRKTVDMCLGVQGKVLLAYKSVRKFKFAKAAQILGLAKVPRGLVSRGRARKKGVSDGDAAASNWLEYRYGWLPLYSTVYGLMEAAYKFSREKPPVIRVSAYQKFEEKFTPHAWGSFSGYYYPFTVYVQPWMWTADFRSQVTGTRRLSVAGVYYYKLTNPLTSGLGVLGLDNPALLAWELVPLSFVADWFVNVSDVLESLSTWNGKQFLSGALTYLEHHDLSFEAEKVTLSGNCTAGYTMPRATSNSKQYRCERVIVTAPETVGLTINISLNAKRIADAAALLKVLVLSR